MDAVSGATERPWPHRSRVVTHGYEDIYSRSTPDAKIFQSGISPKVAKNPLILTINKSGAFRLLCSSYFVVFRLQKLITEVDGTPLSPTLLSLRRS
jgi:hypothetical protein